MGIKMESQPRSRSATSKANCRCGDLEIPFRVMNPINDTPLLSCGLEVVITE